MSETKKSTRALRHEIDGALTCAHGAMQGRPGLTKEQALELIEHAQEHVAQIVPLLAELREITETRDFDAHQAKKAAAKAAAAKKDEEFADNVLSDIAKLLTSTEHPAAESTEKSDDE